MSADLDVVIGGLNKNIKVTYGPRHGENGTGIHYMLTFSNGWGLSVVKAMGTYDIEAGLFNPEGDMPDDNPVMDECVEGWLTADRLIEIIHGINKIREIHPDNVRKELK